MSLQLTLAFPLSSRSPIYASGETSATVSLGRLRSTPRQLGGRAQDPHLGGRECEVEGKALSLTRRPQPDGPTAHLDDPAHQHQADTGPSPVPSTQRVRDRSRR